MRPNLSNDINDLHSSSEKEQVMEFYTLLELLSIVVNRVK